MDTQRMPYSFEEMHLLRRPSPNAIFDGVFIVARNLIKKTYQNYCSTPALVNGPILMLKCIEYNLMADPSSYRKARRNLASPWIRRHAQTVAERNTMTASPEDLAEYDIEEETSAAPEIAESVR
ncbi:hypothetical protein BV898_16344 [Hypsibius exemplaris]|uniref:Uncharacterized protein n=1 Tax=Hypsibius exemplaris TaxID=2072580 RepID=A0A9X6NF45_HYPEX|nr:hypothetical protein BV898_16344 [Hypsibius exemplaris]